MNNKSIKRATRWLGMLSFLLLPLAIIPILSGWLGDLAKDFLFGTLSDDPRELVMFWGGLAGLLAAAVVVIWKGRKFLPANIIEETPSIEPRKVVIALLSPCEELEHATDGHWYVEGVKLPLSDLETLIAKNNGLPSWRWQQTLRAAAYHHRHGALQNLILVGSKDGSGTKEQLTMAKEFFDAIFPGKVVVFGEPEQPGEEYEARWQAEFENLSDISRLLRAILGRLHKKPWQYSDREIIIDCTGGYKVASIAAALVTLDNPDLMFQYVGTGAHAGEITGFNVVTELYRE